MLMSLRSRKVGLPPGTILPSEEAVESQTEISHTAYNQVTHNECQVTIDEVTAVAQKTEAYNWLNIVGTQDSAALLQIGKSFGMSLLTLEDIATPGHRPKFEDCGQYCFFIVQMLSLHGVDNTLFSEQIAIVWSETNVLSFQQYSQDVFGAVRLRLLGNKGRIRSSGSPYLAYALLDVIVDHYFVVVENVFERLSEVENKLLNESRFDPRAELASARQMLLKTSSASVPLKEALRAMRKAESACVPQILDEYLRDLDDHLAEILDLVEVSRVRSSELMEQYQTNIANEMNSIMKVLTIVSTIFIPLTFIAGIYGMNFLYMPELQDKRGYPIVLVFMAVIAALMLVGFKKKKWL